MKRTRYAPASAQVAAFLTPGLAGTSPGLDGTCGVLFGQKRQAVF